MKPNCQDCIHAEVCSFYSSELPVCSYFLDKKIVDKINAVGNVYPITIDDIERILKNVNS